MSSSYVSLLQITDSHLSKNVNFTLQGMNTYDSLHKVLSDIKVCSFDFISITGDISEDGSRASYQHFLKLIQEFGINLNVLVPGNHDNYKKMQSVFDKTVFQQLQFEGNWLFVAINSQVVGEDYGYISSKQLEILKNSIRDNPDKFIVIFMHHHVLPLGSAWIDNYMLHNSDELHAILHEAKNVKAVISGHVHQEFFELYNHIQFFCSPSTCMQFKPNVSQFEIDKIIPGYRKFCFYPDGQITSEVKYIES
jgi:Icc protein